VNAQPWAKPGWAHQPRHCPPTPSTKLPKGATSPAPKQHCPTHTLLPCHCRTTQTAVNDTCHISAHVMPPNSTHTATTSLPPASSPQSPTPAASPPRHRLSAGLPTPTATSSPSTHHLQRQRQTGRVVGMWGRHIGVGKWVGMKDGSDEAACYPHAVSLCSICPPIVGGTGFFSLTRWRSIHALSHSLPFPPPVPPILWGAPFSSTRQRVIHTPSPFFFLYPFAPPLLGGFFFPSTRRCSTQPPSRFIALSPLLLGGFIFLRQGCVLPTQSYSICIPTLPH